MPGLQLCTRIDHLAPLSSHAGTLQNHALAGISTWCFRPLWRIETNKQTGRQAGEQGSRQARLMTTEVIRGARLSSGIHKVSPWLAQEAKISAMAAPCECPALRSVQDRMTQLSFGISGESKAFKLASHDITHYCIHDCTWRKMNKASKILNLQVSKWSLQNSEDEGKVRSHVHSFHSSFERHMTIMTLQKHQPTFPCTSSAQTDFISSKHKE